MPEEEKKTAAQEERAAPHTAIKGVFAGGCEIKIGIAPEHSGQIGDNFIAGNPFRPKLIVPA